MSHIKDIEIKDLIIFIIKEYVASVFYDILNAC